MDGTVTEDDVILAAQAVQRDRRELLGLLSDVADSVVVQTEDGAAVAHLSPSLFAAIRDRTK